MFLRILAIQLFEVSKQLPTCVFLSAFMSSQCLSSVLTNANLTMYHTGVTEVLPQQHYTLARISTQPMSNPSYTSNMSSENTLFYHCYKTLWY